MNLTSNQHDSSQRRSQKYEACFIDFCMNGKIWGDLGFFVSKIHIWGVPPVYISGCFEIFVWTEKFGGIWDIFLKKP